MWMQASEGFRGAYVAAAGLVGVQLCVCVCVVVLEPCECGPWSSSCVSGCFLYPTSPVYLLAARIVSILAWGVGDVAVCSRSLTKE